MTARTTDDGLPVGVSSCLLGDKVRFDAGHKRDRYLTDVLGPFVRWVPVCPEVEAGFGIPRPSMQLQRGPGDGLRLVENKTGADRTGPMQRAVAKRVRSLQKADLRGYVLKKGSPSCGVYRVRVYGDGLPDPTGRGLFAEALMGAFPNLPVEEEGRLHDAKLRENFVERIFAFDRLRTLFGGRWSRKQVVAFHTAHKLQLYAHAPETYRELGRMVADDLAREKRKAFAEAYQGKFMSALAKMASRGRNTNVLQHAAGHLKKLLDSEGRTELSEIIQDYRQGLIPLIVPITLLRHYVKRYRVSYLEGQSYLEPHPKELMLRNHV